MATAEAAAAAVAPKAAGLGLYKHRGTDPAAHLSARREPGVVLLKKKAPPASWAELPLALTVCSSATAVLHTARRWEGGSLAAWSPLRCWGQQQEQQEQQQQSSSSSTE